MITIRQIEQGAAQRAGSISSTAWVGHKARGIAAKNRRKRVTSSHRPRWALPLRTNGEVEACELFDDAPLAWSVGWNNHELRFTALLDVGSVQDLAGVEVLALPRGDSVTATSPAANGVDNPLGRASLVALERVSGTIVRATLRLDEHQLQSGVRRVTQQWTWWGRTSATGTWALIETTKHPVYLLLSPPARPWSVAPGPPRLDWPWLDLLDLLLDPKHVGGIGVDARHTTRRALLDHLLDRLWVRGAAKVGTGWELGRLDPGREDTSGDLTWEYGPGPGSANNYGAAGPFTGCVQRRTLHLGDVIDRFWGATVTGGRVFCRDLSTILHSFGNVLGLRLHRIQLSPDTTYATHPGSWMPRRNVKRPGSNFSVHELTMLAPPSSSASSPASCPSSSSWVADLAIVPRPRIGGTGDPVSMTWKQYRADHIAAGKVRRIEECRPLWVRYRPVEPRLAHALDRPPRLEGALLRPSWLRRFHLNPAPDLVCPSGMVTAIRTRKEHKEARVCSGAELDGVLAELDLDGFRGVLTVLGELAAVALQERPRGERSDRKQGAAPIEWRWRRLSRSNDPGTPRIATLFAEGEQDGERLELRGLLAWIDDDEPVGPSGAPQDALDAVRGQVNRADTRRKHGDRSFFALHRDDWTHLAFAFGPGAVGAEVRAVSHEG